MAAFVFAAERRVLTGPGGTPIRLRPQSMDVLDVLLSEKGRVVTRRELLERVWSGLSVTDDSVSQCVSDIRRALGPRYRHMLKTVPKRGYLLAPERDAVGDPLIRRVIGDGEGVAMPTDAPVIIDGKALVGRTQELQLLRDHWNEAERGHGRVVLLSGVAGIGKSRLADTFLSSIDERAAAPVMLHCSPEHTGTALFPVTQHLTRTAGFLPADTPETRREKARNLLVAARIDSPVSRSVLGGLLGSGDGFEPGGAASALSARERRTHLLQTLARLFVATARRHPLLVVIEDAHWIDPSSQELIESLLDHLESERILVIVSARPPFGVELGAHPLVTRLALNRLSVEQAQTLMSGIAGGAAVPEHVAREISLQSDGVPLFVEEMTKAALLSATGDGETFTVPTSLHDSLMARLERRHPLRHVVQCAACVGRRFSYDEVFAIAALSEDELRAALDQLVVAELIFRYGPTPYADYTFKHALVRDSAHGSLPAARRRHLHRALLDLFTGTPAGTSSVLARHAAAAGLDREAVRLLTLAGDEALAQSAYLEAIDNYRRALEHLPAQGGAKAQADERWAHRRIEMLLKLAHACMAAHGYAHPSTATVYAQAKALLDVAGDSPHRFTVLNGNWLAHLCAGDMRSAAVHATAIVEKWGRSEDPVKRYMAWRNHAMVEQNRGHLERARRSYDLARKSEIPDRESRLIAQFGTDTDMSTRCSMAAHHLYRGCWDSAHALAATLEESAGTSDHVNSRCYVFTRLALLHLMARSSECRPLARRALALADEFGLAMQRSLALTCHGAALVSEGALEPGLEQMREGLQRMTDSNTGLFRAYLEGFRIDGLARTGRIDDALRAGEATFARIDRHDDRLPAPETHRIIAGITHRFIGDTASAIERLHVALDIARAQGTVLWALKSTVTFGRILDEIDRRDEATGRLDDMMNAFPVGGRSLLDYREATALRDELST